MIPLHLSYPFDLEDKHPTLKPRTHPHLQNQSTCSRDRQRDSAGSWTLLRFLPARGPQGKRMRSRQSEDSEMFVTIGAEVHISSVRRHTGRGQTGQIIFSLCVEAGVQTLLDSCFFDLNLAEGRRVLAWVKTNPAADSSASTLFGTEVRRRRDDCQCKVINQVIYHRGHRGLSSPGKL